MQFSSLSINSSHQNNPWYTFSLKSENIESFKILSAAFLKMATFCSRFFLDQNILPTFLNIYAKSCGNPFGSFRYKWGQRFSHMFTVSMATAAILKIPRRNAPLEMGIHLPVQFSEDRIISLWEFGRTKSRREEEEAEGSVNGRSMHGYYGTSKSPIIWLPNRK